MVLKQPVVLSHGNLSLRQATSQKLLGGCLVWWHMLQVIFCYSSYDRC